MSQRSYNFNIYQGLPLEHIDLYNANIPEEDIKSLCFQILQKGMHGICFSLYEDGQKPADIISEGQIRRRLEILKPYTNWVRSFSTIEGNELIPKIAKEMGIKTLVGAWLGDDKEKNEIEVENLIQLCHDGFVDIAAVGNEVLYRNNLTLAELLEKIDYVNSKVAEIPVGYVDAYYEFGRHHELVDVSDVVLGNYYPFGEGTSFENSLGHLHHMHQQVIDAAKGKKIIITETGWPNQGEVTKGAIPNAMSTMKYFINVQMWAQQSDIEMFYFSSFDESWKIDAEGDVGAYWGLWDKNEKLKFV
jgi:exo-beta-1,3-glucanase (GH17 family)